MAALTGRDLGAAMGGAEMGVIVTDDPLETFGGYGVVQIRVVKFMAAYHLAAFA